MATPDQLAAIRFGPAGIGDDPDETRIDALLSAASGSVLGAVRAHWVALQANILGEPETASLGGDASRKWGKDQLGWIADNIATVDALIAEDAGGASASPQVVPIVRTDAERLFTS